MKRLLLLGLAAAVASTIWLLADRPPHDTEEAGLSRPNEAAVAIEELASIPALVPQEHGVIESTRAELAPSPSVPGAGAGVSRGRLVDERTLEPIANARVATRSSSSPTDALGWFDTGESLDELAEVDVVNVARNGSIKDVPRDRWTRLADGWQIPLRIGPTYRLRLIGIDTVRTSLEGRLVHGSREVVPWRSVATDAGSLPYLRYDLPIAEPRPGEQPWVEVRSADGLWDGRGEARSTLGIQDVDVVCRERAVVRGRVVDERGAPWNDLNVDALQLDASGTERLGCKTARDGGYQLGAAQPGRMSVMVLAQSQTRVPLLRLEVPRGITRAPDIVLARKTAGEISGRVTCRSGSGWIDVTLTLRALDGSGYERSTVVGLGSERALRELYARRGTPLRDNEDLGVPAHSISGDFSFEEVPAGTFELSASTTLGLPCSPNSVQVTAPATNVSFTCDDRVSLRSHRLRVVDSTTAPLKPWCVRVFAGNSEIEVTTSDDGSRFRIAEGVALEWRVLTPGHRIARGTERDFTLDGGEYTATCVLQAGFGARLTIESWNGMGEIAVTRRGGLTKWTPEILGGAEILADGVHVATSDERGLAELDLASTPSRIDVRLAGWRVVDSYSFRNGTVTYPEASCRMVRE